MALAESEEEVPGDWPVGDFVADTQLVRDPDTPGRWVGEIPEAWKIQFAFGGISMAVALRAIERELDREDLDVISAHATYCAPISCAPVVADARVLRQGKRAAQGVSDLRNADQEGSSLHATATFGRLDPTHVDLDAPSFPPEAGGPDDWEQPERPDDHPFPQLNFHQQTEFRPCGWPDFGETWEAEEGYACAWTRLVTPPLLADGSTDPLAIVLHSDVLGPAIGMRMGPPDPDTNPNFFVLSLEIDLQIFRPFTTRWVLQQAEAIRAGEGFAAGTLHLWDENRQLLGFAVQRAAMRHFQPGDGFLGEG